jgi:hypothetical protein
MEDPLMADDEGESESRRPFGASELLAIPKHSLIVVGYTKQERMKELRHTISVKRKPYNASFFFMNCLF